MAEKAFDVRVRFWFRNQDGDAWVRLVRVVADSPQRAGIVARHQFGNGFMTRVDGVRESGSVSDVVSLGRRVGKARLAPGETRMVWSAGDGAVFYLPGEASVTGRVVAVHTVSYMGSPHEWVVVEPTVNRDRYIRKGRLFLVPVNRDGSSSDVFARNRVRSYRAGSSARTHGHDLSELPLLSGADRLRVANWHAVR